MCAPVYVVGLLLLLTFGSGIALVDIGVTIHTTYVPFGENPIRWLGAIVVPWIVLGLPVAGLCLRMMRGATVEVVHEEYIRAAAAKGLSERAVLRRHAPPPRRSSPSRARA